MSTLLHSLVYSITREDPGQAFAVSITYGEAPTARAVFPEFVILPKKPRKL